MQYILAILVLMLILSVLVGKWMRRKEIKREEYNDFMYNKKEHEFFEGKNKMKVDYNGKLINSDEHIEDIR